MSAETQTFEKHVQPHFNLTNQPAINDPNEALEVVFKDPINDDEAVRQIALRRQTYKGNGELSIYKTGSQVYFGDHNRHIVTLLKPIIVEKCEYVPPYGKKTKRRQYREHLITNAVYEHHSEEDDRPRTELRGGRVTILDRENSLLKP